MGKIDDVLAEMRQERDRLALELARAERVIAALEEAGADAIVVRKSDTPTQPPAEERANVPQGVGPYSLLDIYEATRHYLLTVGTPKNSTEIAAALRAGGFKTRSKSLVNTVRVMLRRKDGRTTGISVTKDGTRWFVKRKAPIRTPRTPSTAK